MNETKLEDNPFFKLIQGSLEELGKDPDEWLRTPHSGILNQAPIDVMERSGEEVLRLLLDDVENTWVPETVNEAEENTVKVADEPQEILLWVDVETTGLNPIDSELLQVAAIVTDLQGNVISPEFNKVIHFNEFDARRLRANAVSFVQEMHDKTNLWERLTSQGVQLGLVDNELEAFIKTFELDGVKPRLAGNSVRLDLNFLEAFLPKSYARVHYRSVDVSALDYALKAWGVVEGEYVKEATHDALDDIRESIAQYKWVMHQTVLWKASFNTLKNWPVNDLDKPV